MRLKVGIVAGHISALVVFQFRFGAIKRIFNIINSDNKLMFQFRFGAIKSENKRQCLKNCVTRFNSDLVRLKGEIAGANGNLVATFQFRFGAIKRDTDVIVIVKEFGFQFRFGAIKRIMKILNAYAGIGFQFRFGAIKRG